VDIAIFYLTEEAMREHIMDGWRDTNGLSDITEIDLNNYEYVARFDLPIHELNRLGSRVEFPPIPEVNPDYEESALHWAFSYCQNVVDSWSKRADIFVIPRADGLGHRSMMVSDVVAVGNHYYIVKTTGFAKVLPKVASS
jgi:hypothetical protein